MWLLYVNTDTNSMNKHQFWPALQSRNLGNGELHSTCSASRIVRNLACGSENTKDSVHALTRVSSLPKHVVRLFISRGCRVMEGINGKK